MKDFADDRLGNRLTTLPLRMDPAAIVQRALAAGQLRARPRLRIRSAVALVPLMLTLFAALAGYYAPVFAQALADAPIAGGVTGPFLRSAGLAGLAHRITSLSDSTSSAGYRADLLGGYADGAATVLVLRLTPGARLVPVFSGPSLDAAVTLTDQFGSSYRLISLTSQADTGETALSFTPLASPATSVGARLALSFNTLEDRSGASPRAIRGDWTLRGTVAIEPSREVPAPANITLGSTTISFAQVRAYPALLLIEMRITGTDVGSLTRIVPDGGKGHPAFGAVLLGADGRERQGLLTSMREQGGGTATNWMWQVEGDGQYRLTVTFEGVGQATREVTLLSSR